MADAIYNKFKAGLLQGSYNLTSLPLYVALVTSSYTFDADHDYVSVIGTGEVGGVGYSTGGLAVSSPNVEEDDTGDQGVLWGTNIVWDGGTFTARAGILYGSSGLGFASDPLVAFYDFTEDKTVTAGTFTLQFNAAGMLNCT